MTASRQPTDNLDIATATVVCKKEDFQPVPASLKMRFLADRLILAEARKTRRAVPQKLLLQPAELGRLHFAVRENAYIFQNDALKIVVELAPRQKLAIQAFEHGAPRSVGSETTEAIRNYLARRSILRPVRESAVEMFWDATATDATNSASDVFGVTLQAPTIPASNLLLSAEESFAIENAMRSENVKQRREALHEFHATARLTAESAADVGIKTAARQHAENAYGCFTNEAAVREWIARRKLEIAAALTEEVVADSREGLAETAHMTLELAFTALTADVPDGLRRRDMPGLIAEAIDAFDPFATTRTTLSLAYEELATGSAEVAAIRISLSARESMPGLVAQAVDSPALMQDAAVVTLESAYSALLADLTPLRIRLHSAELNREIALAIDAIKAVPTSAYTLETAYAAMSDLADHIITQVAIIPATNDSLADWTLRLNASAENLWATVPTPVELSPVAETSADCFEARAILAMPTLAPLRVERVRDVWGDSDVSLDDDSVSWSAEPTPSVTAKMTAGVTNTELTAEIAAVKPAPVKPRVEDPEFYRDLGLKITRILTDITTSYCASDIRKGLATLSQLAQEHAGLLNGMDVPEFPEACRRSFRAIILNEKLFIDDLDDGVLELGVNAGMDDELVKLQIADKALAIFLKGLALDSSPHLKKSRADKIRHLGILTTRRVMMKSSKYHVAKKVVNDILTFEAKVTDKAKRNNELVETYAYLTHWMEGV